MTREEARYLLNNLRSVAEEKEDEAIDMAIEALQTDEVVIIKTGQTHGKSAYIKELAEVVRCKGCRWWNSETNGCKRNPSVEAWHEDDFCSYGERREP